MKKALVIFAITIASIYLTYIVSQRYQFFPATIQLSYHSADAEAMTIYFDIGAGFQQRTRYFSALEQRDFDEKFKLHAPLPFRQVHAIRIDLDSADANRKQQSIAIEELCLNHTRQQHCWSAEELFKAFVPMNAVGSHDLILEHETPALFVQANSSDPHFRLDIPIAEIHAKVAKIAKFQFALLAVLLAIIFFYAQKLLSGFVLPKLLNAFNQQRHQSFTVPLNTAVAGVTLLSIALSGVWLIAYQAGVWASALLVGGVSAIALLPSVKMVSLKPSFFTCWSRSKHYFHKSQLLTLFVVAVITLLPIIIFLASTWVQEFPHLGDHEYHFWGNRVSYRAIDFNATVLLFGLLCIALAYVLGLLRWAVIIVAILLVSTGFWNVLPDNMLSDTQGIFSRYPGGARVLAHPFIHWTYQFQWADPLNAGRILNALSVPIWLLLLRPVIIGRAPSWEILLISVLFFWQAEVVYQFSSAYLDIWSVIFILLATEKLIVSQTQQSRMDDNGYLKACLLLGIACAFKEPAVFIIPWFWFAGWSLGVFKTFTGKALFQRFYQACVIGFASVLPFLVYFIVRKTFGVSRYTVKGFEYFLGGEWFAEMATRIGFHFGWFGSVMLVMILLLWLVVFIAPIWKAQRWLMACIFGALLTQIVLFNWDQGGIAFTGYFRFYLPALVLFSAPLILIAASRELLAGLFPKVILLISVILLLGNAPTLYATAAKLSEPDSARNFNEHYDAPIYLPIRSLIKTAEAQGVLEGENRAIYINHVTSWNQPAFVYSDLLIKYKLRMEEDLKCGCSVETPSVLAPFVNIVGLNERIQDMPIEEIKQIPQHQAKYVERWREVNESKGMCVAEIERSCQYSAKQSLSDGTVIGIIGVGAK